MTDLDSINTLWAVIVITSLQLKLNELRKRVTSGIRTNDGSQYSIGRATADSRAQCCQEARYPCSEAK
jgi:hypothetical protein